MARRGVRQQSGEDFSDSSILRVIKALESDKPISKREACDMLRMTYNTSRLNRIIEEYKQRQQFKIDSRKALRGKPVTTLEKKTMVKLYIDGASMTEIEDTTFRSAPVIKAILRRYNVPLRESDTNYFKPIYLESSDRDDYSSGDLVYSARYNSPAYIDKYIGNDRNHGKVYRLYVVGAKEHFAIQPYYELADLTKAQVELGIRAESLSKDEINMLLIEALKTAKKMEKQKR